MSEAGSVPVIDAIAESGAGGDVVAITNNAASGSCVSATSSATGSPVAEFFGASGSSQPTINAECTDGSSSAVFATSQGAAGSANALRGVVIDADGYAAELLCSPLGAPKRAPLRLVPSNQPATGQVGDLNVSNAGVLTICTVAGAPGTWAPV